MSHILCVSDDRHLVKILEKALETRGYRVSASYDGEQALEIFRTELPSLLVLDVALPKLDGFEVLSRLRSLAGPECKTPVILTSASRITKPVEERARSLHAQALLVKPVSLKRLLKVIEKFVKAPAPSIHETSQEQLPLEGSFKELSFPHLLHQLHGLQATGVLQVVDGKRRKLIELSEGCPIAVKSNIINECLGNSLVRRGLISEESFDESVRRMKRGEGLQGQVLVAMDVLSESELVDALRSQALEKILEVFNWTRGSFRFQLKAKLQRANSLSLDGGAANLIVEGIRREFPQRRVDDFFRRNGHRFVSPGHSDFYRFQDISLLPEEEELISTLDGSRALGEIGQDDDRLRRTLFGLVITEFVTLRESSTPGAAKATGGTAYRMKRGEPGSSLESNRDVLQRNELADIAEGLRGQNYFEMLGLEPDARPEAIDSAFGRLVKQVHPDRYAASGSGVRALANEAFELLSEAYETLSDPRECTRYALELKQGERKAAREEAGRIALDAEVNFQKGEALLKKRDYETALMYFGQALEGNSDEGEYHAHYGWCLYLCHPENVGMVQEAIEHVRRGVKLSNGRATSHLYLGRLYKVVGRTAAAEKLFTRALQIQPECVEAIRELRLINLRRDKGGLIGKIFRR